MNEIGAVTSFISSLSASGLMALIIVILGFIIKNFYEKSETERKILIEKILVSIKSLDRKLEESNNHQKTSNLIAEQQKTFFEKNYLSHNDNTTKIIFDGMKTFQFAGKKMEEVSNQIAEVKNGLDDLKKDNEILKKGVQAELKQTSSLVNLWNRSVLSLNNK